MQEKLREVLDGPLSDIAYNIAWLLRKIEWQPNQFSARENDYSRRMVRETVNHRGKTAYAYYPMQGNGQPRRIAKILFYDLQIAEAGDIQLGQLEQFDVGAEPKTVADEYINDSPSEIELRKEKEKETEKETEKSFSELAELEYTRRVTARGGVAFEGIEAGAEVEEEFRARVEVSAEQHWRKSDRLRESQEWTTTVKPFHKFSITATETIKNLRQNVTANGRLNAGIFIEGRDFSNCELAGFDELLSLFRGLLPGGGSTGRRFADWFRQPGKGVSDADLQVLQSPTVTLTLPIQANRARLTNVRVKQIPLEGHEKKRGGKGRRKGKKRRN